MSRETDSSSSGPQGRGGAAYPSGTPPYGPRPFPSLHPQERPQADQEQDGAGAAEQGRNADAAGEPRTETTLTTRIRINIPGSRPIPPVVMRTTVEEGAAASAGPQAAGAADTPDAGGAAASAGEPAAEGGQGGQDGEEPSERAEKAEKKDKKEKTSDWFVPRKPVGSSGPGASPATGPGAGQAPGNGPRGDGFQGGAAAGAPGAGPAPAGFPPGVPATGDGFSEGFSGDGFQGDFPRGAAPAGGTSGGGFTVPPAADGSFFGAGTPAAGTPQANDPFPAPYTEQFSDPDTGTQQIPQAFLPPPVGSPFDDGPAARGPHDTPSDGFPRSFETPPGAAGGAEQGTGNGPFGTEGFPPGVPRGIPTDPFGDGGAPLPPAGATTGPATGDMAVPPVTGDTGEHAFRPPNPAGSRPSGKRSASDTLVGGIPPVPADEGRDRSAGRPGAAGPGSVPPGAKAAAGSAAGAPAPSSPAASAKPAKKGRSKPALLGAAVVGVAVVAYGAGLLMNHSDVPKGTTVLGVDIGNTSQAAAVKKLDTALGNRGTAALTITVGGKQHSLKPSIAGLSVDTDATVRKVAHPDYNPVSVVGSLFGQTRVEEPVVVVDQDKLKAALTSVAGPSAQGSDGMVRFEDGKAVPVPGKPSQAVDVDAAATQVSAAYRQRAESGRNTPVDLKVTTVQPKVTQAALDKAVSGFGKTAMMGPVHILAAGHDVPFENTLPQFLTMQATADGQLAPHIDLKTLQSLYGNSFDGVLLERGDGSKTAVTPQDVATALIQALNSKTIAGRSVTLPDAVLG
ncbi:hypothetical protein RVR_6690 [Actinacidiphila reveromycinica]|uniref:Peptidoglycan binding domain-containing protein n=1 Tax=Actinacidiphila reveromycinica TaxID=659352 RepID=A0A7U3VQK0_9ACTN|nr:hypothetical protein [Streptomyces sp. SN-593]BBA99875.1 hypothetical protein RVR_6690 [Streptomyces sp. SN-593]